MSRAAGFLYGVSRQKFTLDRETRDKAGATCWDVPLPSNLHGKIFRQHGIEDRLLRKPRRKRPHSGSRMSSSSTGPTGRQSVTSSSLLLATISAAASR